MADRQWPTTAEEFVERLDHEYDGDCPDRAAGWDSRDPDCPACRLLDEAWRRFQLAETWTRIRWCRCGQPFLPAVGLYGTAEEQRCQACVLRSVLERERGVAQSAACAASETAYRRCQKIAKKEQKRRASERADMGDRHDWDGANTAEGGEYAARHIARKIGKLIRRED